MFSCEYCGVFKNSFFYRTPVMAASGDENEALAWNRLRAGLEHTTQKTFTCSKSTIKALEKIVKYV